jgi:hypothetical protein
MTINDNINSIKRHLDKIKVRQDDDDLYRIEQSRKLDLIVNALTDTDFNGRNGHLTRFNKIEVMVLQHEMYWKLLITIVISSGIITGLLKILLP